MNYHPLSSENMPVALRLYNQAAGTDMVHKPLSSAQFSEKFLKTAITGQHNIGLVSEDGLAFAAGCYVETEAKKAYVTMVIVEAEQRRKGYGRNILQALEKALLAESGFTTLELSFFNPQTLEWIVPGTDGHDHPNTPGIDVASGSYLFFKNCGYYDGSCQNSYHIDLPSYEYPADIQKRIERLKENGIEILLYDSKIHSGLADLIESLDNDMWRRDILGEMRKEAPRPLLVAVRDGRTQGFTGPLDVQPSGRGYFAGIGVHESCRGAGAAKVLFSKLCMSLKEMGAGYMTLFTGETNPARNIYEAAGFKIVHSWSVMRKNT